ncbi:fatty acid amide hydrolase [Prunus yedoensis var. nudiflora]|uniref:Fatty acid amide hydrolase n=1 Tax=Prunus yedoensis var. nudiflora TaxID=2094558 RepID=A0A314YYT0_PRUYE|nr:fatty acid amide hydrolase [Prunus yedoensis var. nudiflora]
MGKESTFPIPWKMTWEMISHQIHSVNQTGPKGGTTWMHEVRTIKKDAVSVSRLRSCGVIFVGKENMHELGMGTTGNNSNYGSYSVHRAGRARKELFYEITNDLTRHVKRARALQTL